VTLVSAASPGRGFPFFSFGDMSYHLRNLGEIWMATLLIVEDQPNDIRVAAEATRSLGFTNVQARTSARAAQLYLDAALEAKEPMPDVIVVDLDLGYDSGFELLRFWHSHRELAGSTRMIVWTAMGEPQMEICRLFKVAAVVSKAEGIEALTRALQPFAAKAS
jgi:CheY-like chemotaxis protein